MLIEVDLEAQANSNQKGDNMTVENINKAIRVVNCGSLILSIMTLALTIKKIMLLREQ